MPFLLIFIAIILHKQESLINSGSISKGMDCNSLSRTLGKPKDLSWLWLGNKKGEYGHYVLMEVYSRKTSKIHYLCEAKRTANEESDIALEVLKDHDLIHFHGCWKFSHIIYFIISKLMNIKILISPHGMLDPYSMSQKRTFKLIFWHLFPFFFFGKGA